MSQYTAEVLWRRGEQAFVDNRYSRKYAIKFDGGIEVAGSASPQVVPPPLSDLSAVDPEELLVAALAGCHMLWFLSIAAKRHFRVDRYVDAPTGVLSKNAAGQFSMTSFTLKPEATFSGDNLPTRAQIDEMHHEAHEKCNIANSINGEVRCEPIYPAA